MLKKIEDILAKTDGLESFQTIGGYGAVTSTYQPNYGTIFVRMKPWEERKTKALHVNGIMGGLRPQFAAIPEAVIFPFNIPTLSGFGAASGFNFLLQDRSGSLTIAQLGEQTQKFLAAARQRPELGTVFTSFDPNYPQVRVDLDREKARTLGVPVNEVFQALSTTLGGTYVNDFNRFGRLYRVYAQSDAVQRLKAEDIGKIYVRSKTTNEMVPLSTLVTIRDIAGAELTTRFNLQRSVEIQGSPAPGYTSGQALAALEQVFAETMPSEMGFAYSSMSYQEKIAPPAGPTFIMAIVCVFLLLAALYESWRLPWAVLLGSPLVALGAFFGVWLMGFDNNVYVQIGLVMLIGLAAKNAILIVEFAKAKHEGGASLEEAALESARLRFRPILMTAFAFILGVVPLMLASGAGAGAQNVMGTGVFWGMLVATALGVFIIPGNYTFVEGLGRRGKTAADGASGRSERARSRVNGPRTNSPALRRGGHRQPAAWSGLITSGRTCSLPPDYRGADAVPTAANAPTYGDLAWWSVFPDPDLQELIRTALAQNYDVRVAAARILQAQSQVTIARSPIFPTVDGSVNGPYNAYTGSERPLPDTPSSRRPDSTWPGNWTSGAGTAAARRQHRPSCSPARTSGTGSSRRWLPRSVSAYLTLRALDLTLEISKRTVASRKQSLELVNARLEGGVAGILDVRQAETLLYTATKTIPEIQRQIEQQENFINILLGQNPGPVKRGRPLEQQIAAPALPPGLPTELLTRRPDIRAAEQQLVAANAQIGVAKSLLYPQVTISGFAGAGSSTISGSNFGPYGVFSALPAITLPIFNAGRLRANVDFNEAAAQEAALRYQQTLQQALREVSDSLVDVRKRQEFREQQELLVNALADASQVANMRYEGGVSSYLEVLDTERQLFDAERDLVLAQDVTSRSAWCSCTRRSAADGRRNPPRSPHLLVLRPESPAQAPNETGPRRTQAKCCIRPGICVAGSRCKCGSGRFRNQGRRRAREHRGIRQLPPAGPVRSRTADQLRHIEGWLRRTSGSGDQQPRARRRNRVLGQLLRRPVARARKRLLHGRPDARDTENGIPVQDDFIARRHRVLRPRFRRDLQAIRHRGACLRRARA